MTRLLVFLLLIPVLLGSVVFAQKPSTPEKESPATDSPKAVSPAVLEHEFFAVIRNGDALKFLSYVPEDGVNLGHYAEHSTRAEIEEQLTHRTGLYCKLFDSACIAPD